jgi:hypothetical protein
LPETSLPPGAHNDFVIATLEPHGASEIYTHDTIPSLPQHKQCDYWGLTAYRKLLLVKRAS